MDINNYQGLVENIRESKIKVLGCAQVFISILLTFWSPGITFGPPTLQYVHDGQQ